MDHSYIDAHTVAERFLTKELSEEDFAAFSNHSAWCEECQDRVLLAQVWLEQKPAPAANDGETLPRPQKVFEEPKDTIEAAVATSSVATSPVATNPIPTNPLQDYRQATCPAPVPFEAQIRQPASSPADSKPYSNGKAAAASFPGFAEQAFAKKHPHRTVTADSLVTPTVSINDAPVGVTMALVRVSSNGWQLPALVNMATALSVALEIIRGQQEQIVARAQERWSDGNIPSLARFVMQFAPWQLAAIGALAALLLVLMPATLFVWELRQLLR